MALQILDAPASRKVKQISSALVTANNFLASTGLGDALIDYAKGILAPKSQMIQLPSKRGKSNSKSNNNRVKNLGGKATAMLVNYNRPLKSTLFQAPSNMGFQLPPAHMNHCGTADRLADRSVIGSLKVKGGCLMDVTAAFYSASPTLFTHGVVNGGSGSIDVPLALMDVLELDPRLENTAKCYAFWKFRAFKLHYVPLVATNTNGVLTTAIFDDVYAAEQYFAAPYTSASNVGQQAALTSQWSNCSPIWTTHTTTYSDRGAKLFPTVYESVTVDDTYQCCVIILVSNFQPINGTNPSASTGYNIGQFFLEYEIDFYDPVWGLNETLTSHETLPRHIRKIARDQAFARRCNERRRSSQLNQVSSNLSSSISSPFQSVSLTPCETSHTVASSFTRR